MIEYLNYKEQQLPFRVSYYALKHYELETGKSISSLTEEPGSMEILLFYALEAGHKAEGKQFTLVREDMEMLLDEVYLQFAEKVKSFFPKADAVTVATDEGKKK